MGVRIKEDIDLRKECLALRTVETARFLKCQYFLQMETELVVFVPVYDLPYSGEILKR